MRGAILSLSESAFGVYSGRPEDDSVPEFRMWAECSENRFVARRGKQGVTDVESCLHVNPDFAEVFYFAG